MTWQVKSIQIQRFKNLMNVLLPLGEVNVLVGTNNAGKSAVLQAVQFMISAAQSVGVDGLKAGENQQVATISPTSLYYSPADEVMALSHGAPLTQNQNQAIRLQFEVGPSIGPVERFHVSALKGRNGNLAVRTTAGRHWTSLSSLERPFSMYVPGLAGIAPVEAYLTPAAVRKAAARGHGNAVLRNVLWQLQHDTSRWQTFEKHLDAVFPGQTVRLSHSPESDERVYTEIGFDSVRLPLGLAGTGLLQTLQILAYMNLYAPRLLLLDEPDSHIHPDKQRALLAVIQDWAATNGSRVLIATHSRHLLDTMDGRAAFHWMQAGKRRDEQDYDRLKVMMDLGALDRSDRLRNGEVDGVVLTEDATAADTHPKKGRSALRTLLESAGLNMNRVQVWSYEGCTNLGTACALADFIRDHAPGVRVLVHRDRDYEPDREMDELKAKLDVAGIASFITQGTDTEAHLLSINHVLELHDGLDRDALVAAIEESTQAQRDQSLRRFTAAADRRLKYAANKPSSLDITRDCERKLDSDPARYRYGKKVFGVFLGKVQSMLGANPNLFAPTVHVVVPELTAFAATLPIRGDDGNKDTSSGGGDAGRNAPQKS